MENPICLLETLKQTGDKVAIFCEGGQIHLPGKATSLYILLEKMVYQVATKEKKGITRFPSFHPKCWLIRYVNDKDKKDYHYRFVILSRNLTFDRSWDVSFYMDGIKGEKKTDKNKPLADFLSYLVKQMPEEKQSKKEKIITLIKELPYVTFETEEFDDYEFLPMGIPYPDSQNVEYSILNTPLIKESFHELLVMSPFLSKDKRS
jgi:hypothetical protein